MEFPLTLWTDLQCLYYFTVQSEGEDSSMPLFMIVPGRAKDVLIDIEWQGLVGNQVELVSLI